MSELCRFQNAWSKDKNYIISFLYPTDGLVIFTDMLKNLKLRKPQVLSQFIWHISFICEYSKAYCCHWFVPDEWYFRTRPRKVGGVYLVGKNWLSHITTGCRKVRVQANHTEQKPPYQHPNPPHTKPAWQGWTNTRPTSKVNLLAPELFF